MTCDCPSCVAVYRPYAMKTPGTGWTPSTSNPATAPARVSPIEETRFSASSTSPESAATTMRTCCACCVPIQTTSRRLAVSEPTIAPSVFAA
jgi:hypothetical protein